MIIRKLFRNRGLGMNLIAGLSFLFLVVYAWGLTWRELGGYLLVILIFLVGLIALAAVCGWLLRKLIASSADRDEYAVEEDTDNTEPASTDTGKSDIKPGVK